jgi:sulfoxide reductase catalytic subunit YedY
MLIKKPADIPAREITDQSVYLNRRTFLRAGVLVASTAATAGIYRTLTRASVPRVDQVALGNVVGPAADALSKGFFTAEPKTPYEVITGYNNYYEFSTNKEAVAGAAEGFVSTPWSVAVEGLCAKPKVFDLDDLVKLAPTEERVYRMRCVEGWSMVIPWDGLQLSKLLDAVEPSGNAKFVAFETLMDPRRMPNQNHNVLAWPYIEGLRMDEAMNPLTLLATGIYGKKLPPQDGAPIRLVVPWKYGFKGIKSIVKIKLLADQPQTTWNIANPIEYGFYANVNPSVPNPRYSQATERRLPTAETRPTLMFNGYADQVASLYAGLDLRANY